MSNKPPKELLVEGPIPPEKLATSVANHQSKTSIGAHSIFLGQVRADEVEGQRVAAIEFTAYHDMANAVYTEIREEAFAKYELTCAHVYHSTGLIAVGELCFYVFTSSPRRKAAMEACEYFVEQIKARVPLFGKEIFEDQGHKWRTSTGG